MFLLWSLAFALLYQVSALKEVNQFIAAVPASVKFATDVPGLVEKVKHTAEAMKHFHDMSQDPQVVMTWDDVGRCDGEDGRPLYLVINNVIYDFTEYAAYHPAGPEPLKARAGQDATTAVKAMDPRLYEPFLHFLRVGTIASDQQDNSTVVESAFKNSIMPRLE